jgi:HlyD family secretion protein
VAAHRSGDEGLEQILSAGKRRSRWRRVIILSIVAIVVAVAVLVGFRVFGGGGAAAAQSYETAAVTRGELKAAITATGTVEALNTVEVGAEVSGKIAALHTDFNDSVTAGQLLAEIDPEQAEAAVAQAKAQVLGARASVAEAKASLEAARLDADRSKALAEKGLLSSKELEAAVAKGAQAKAALQSARASAAIADASYLVARNKRGKTEINAPISGTVLSRVVEVGQTINAGMQTPVLFTIAEDLRSMQLSSKVDEADIGAIKVDQAATFTVDAYPERSFASSVLSVRNVPILDQNVVSYEVLLTVDNGELLLKPGMTASVEIVTMRMRDALLVPNKALRFSPPAPAHGPPRGMMIPGIGGPPEKGSAADPARSLERLGKLSAKQGVVWVLAGTTPKPVVVEKLATDGVSTAIVCDALPAGTQVIVDLGASAGTAE